MEIIWRAAALDDLEEIRRFIAQDNPSAASRVQAVIRAAVERLADHPSLGRAGSVAGTRELVVARTPYIVAYRVYDNQLRILSVLHGARKWPERFNQTVSDAVPCLSKSIWTRNREKLRPAGRCAAGPAAGVPAAPARRARPSPAKELITPAEERAAHWRESAGGLPQFPRLAVRQMGNLIAALKSLVTLTITWVMLS